MPKHVVHRLQKIESDLKTVVSLYEVADRSQSNDKPETSKEQNSKQFPKISAPRRMETVPVIDKFREVPGKPQTPLLDSFKKTNGFIPRSSQGLNSGESVTGKKCNQTKPGSVPSSCSTLSTICESDYIWQQSSETDGSLEQVLSKAKTSENLNSDWLESGGTFSAYGVVMTPSKTLETAHEILAKNNFNDNETQNYSLTRESVPCRGKPKEVQRCRTEGETTGLVLDDGKAKNCDKNKVQAQISETDVNGEQESKKKLEPKRKLSEKLNFRIKTDEKSDDDKMDEKKTRSIFEKDKKQHADGGIQERSSQKKNNVEGDDDTDLWIKEISKIIEKSNEKLEKMKVSKELALDIAKHLKNKYDEITKSREELIEKVKILERNNERLNSEIKQARDLKYQLQQKIEGPMNSNTRVAENPKTKKADKEVFLLKTKLSASQKKQNSDVEKAVKTEDVQKDWFGESRNSPEVLKDKIHALTTKNFELLTKLNELQRQLYESQAKEESLQENVRQLNEEVQKQKEQLKIKTKAINETNTELQVIRQNSTELEEQVKVLKKNLENFDGLQQKLFTQTSDYEQQKKEDEEKIKQLQDENERLKVELENEKDALLIKIKIIEDQQESIKQLKEKIEDAKSYVKRNQSLERVLNNEREEKLELQEAVERLKWRKQELKKKVKTLENDFLLAPQEVVKDLQKTQIVLHELENQVQVKQKEWELQIQSLIKEKEQACRVAEFATKKLREATCEFQKQSDAYKDLQRILAENLVVKQKYSREGSYSMKNP